MKSILMFFLVMTFFQSYSAAQSVSCKMFTQAFVSGEEKTFRIVDPGDFSFELHHIGTKKPFLVANAGTGRLLKLSENSKAIWLAEAAPSGAIMIYTYFKLSRKVIFSKQYSLLGNPVATMLYGKCVGLP